MPSESRTTRIAVFYDGNYFMHVSNFYMFHHEKKSRINISGLHSYIERKVAEAENIDQRFCHIVDTHYFRGRPSAGEAQTNGTLYGDRVFDDILMREGVTTHYLPNIGNSEKGIDVWLALEALELTLYKKFDIIVLVAGDGDFVPLVRKLTTAGARVMLLGWDFKYDDAFGKPHETRVSQNLISEVTYPVLMQNIIDDRAAFNNQMISDLFAQPRTESPKIITPVLQTIYPTGKPVILTGLIDSLDSRGFGYITPSEGTEVSGKLFFHANDLCNRTFDALKDCDPVEYELGRNSKGICAVNVKVTTPAG